MEAILMINVQMILLKLELDKKGNIKKDQQKIMALKFQTKIKINVLATKTNITQITMYNNRFKPNNNTTQTHNKKKAISKIIFMIGVRSNKTSLMQIKIRTLSSITN